MSASFHNPLVDGVPFAGVHLLAEFWDPVRIEEPEALRAVIAEAARRARCEVLCLEVRTFEPQGITGFALLAESHLSIHSWPELGFVAIDLFTCGLDTAPHAALAYLREVYNPGRVDLTEVKRGLRDPRLRR